MNTPMNSKQIFAFVDEAGAKGYLRGLSASRDPEFALMVSVLVDQQDHNRLEALIRPGYGRFVQAAPQGAVLHFAEAFEDPTSPWATVAGEVRSEFTALLLQEKLPIIYSAFRVSDKRYEYDQREQLAQRAVDLSSSDMEIKHGVDKSTLETDTFQDLLIKVGTYAEDLGAVIDVRLDDTSKGLLKAFRGAGRDLEKLGETMVTPEAYDRTEGKVVKGSTGTFRVHSGFALPVTTIRSIEVASKTDPFILLIDGVANSLNHHLRKLSPQVNLEDRASLSGWALSELVQLAP